MSSFLRLVLAMIFFLSMSDAIRVNIGYVSWVPLVLYISIAVFFFRKKFSLDFTFLSISVFLSLVLVNSIFSIDPANSIFRFFKFIFIFIFLYLASLNRSTIPVLIFSLKLVVFLNFVFIVIGMLGVSGFSGVGGGNRWWTLLSTQGTLYVCGLLYIVFYMSDYFTNTNYLSENSKVLDLIFLMMAVFVMLMDGSRSAVVGLLVLLFYFVFSRGRIKVLFKRFLFLVVILFFAFLVLSNLPDDLIQFERAMSLLESQGASKMDDVRYFLMKNSIDWIANNNPVIIGKGFSTTIFEDGYTLVVHNGYLQIWESLGLFALVSFLLLLLSPLFYSLKMQWLFNDNKFTLPSALLIYFLLNLVFHPVATEYGPWLFYLIAGVLISRLNSSRIEFRFRT